MARTSAAEQSGVPIGLFHEESFDHLVAKKMALEDLFHVRGLDPDVPDAFRVDHHDRPLGTLVQTTGLIDTNFGVKSCFYDQIFQRAVDLFASDADAVTSPVPAGALVDADKNMFAKDFHEAIIRPFFICCAKIPGLF